MLDILLALEAKLQALADKAVNLEQHVVDDVKEAVAHVAHLKTFFGTVQTAEQVTEVVPRVMRAKVFVSGFTENKDTEGRTTSIRVRMAGVAKNTAYPTDGADEDNTFALWSPSVALDMQITNPALFKALRSGMKMYCDFTESPDSPAPAVGPATTEVAPVAVAAPAAETQVATDAPAAAQPAAQ